MKKLITLLAVIATIQGFGQVNKGMPGIMEVVNKFFSKYQHPDSQKTLIRFQKRAGGWFIAEYDFETASTNKSAKLFWDKNNQQYIALDYPLNDNTDTSAQKYISDYISYYIDYFEQYCFDRIVFYGYDGWDKDVIDFVEKIPNPGDTLLESLARGYSSYAINYFYPQYGYLPAEADPDMAKLKNSEPIPAIRIQKFLSAELKAIKTYEKLASNNSKYQTTVGSIDIKLTNERMFAFTTLTFLGHKKEGEAFLKGIQYSDSLLSIADSVFMAVKSKGIIFTSGDNMTYPLMYLQFKGIRNDVVVIDFNLLGLQRVITYFDKQFNHSLLSTDSAVYLDSKFNYARFEDGYVQDKQLPLDSFLAQIYKSCTISQIKKDGKLVDYNNDGTFKFFTKNPYLKVDRAKASILFQSSNIVDTIPLPVTRDYLLINEIIEFAILQKNFGRRHIYFSFPPDNSVYEKYSIQRGPIWELTPEIH